MRHCDYIKEGRADKIDSVLRSFLLAIIDQDDAKAFAMCTPEIRTSVQPARSRRHLRSGAELSCQHDRFRAFSAPIQFMKTGCELSGTIQHQGGRSSSYHIDLVRTPEELWHEWKISAFNFEPVSVSTPLIEAMKAVLQKNAASPQKAVARMKAIPPRKTGAGKKGLPRKKAVAQKKALPRKKAVTGKKAVAAQESSSAEEKSSAHNVLWHTGSTGANRFLHRQQVKTGNGIHL